MLVNVRAKIGILFLSIFLLIIGGIFMLRELNNDKQALEIDLYSHIPTDISSILQINGERYLKLFETCLDGVQPVITHIQSAINYPFLIVQQANYQYIVAKVTNEQQSFILNLLNNTIFASYPPKEKIYKNTKLLFYTTENNTFFVCMFYKGIFVGGYNSNLLERLIDMNEKEAPGISRTPIGQEALNKMKAHYPGNLLLNNNSSFSVFNIEFEDNDLRMEGYDTGIDIHNWVCDSINKDSMKIDYSIFPNIATAYSIDMDNPLLTDTFKCYFLPPSYSFYIEKKAMPIYILKHKGSKFDIYNMLNNLEENYIKQRFNTNDYSGNNRIYKTSLRMGKEVFHRENPMYLTFHKDHLVYCEDRSTLTEYLKYNGKFSLEKGSYPQASFVFYTINPERWYPSFFNPDNPICQNRESEAYIISYPENNKRKLEVYLKNKL